MFLSFIVHVECRLCLPQPLITFVAPGSAEFVSYLSLFFFASFSSFFLFTLFVFHNSLLSFDAPFSFCIFLLFLLICLGLFASFLLFLLILFSIFIVISTHLYLYFIFILPPFFINCTFKQQEVQEPVLCLWKTYFSHRITHLMNTMSIGSLCVIDIPGYLANGLLLSANNVLFQQ